MPRRGYRFVADVREVAGPDTAVEGPKTTAEPERVASGTAVATVPAGAARTAQARRRVVAWAGAIATIAAGVGVGFFVRQRDGDRVADVAAPHSAPTTTLAVLPFRPLAEAGGPRDEVLELGMADSLITVSVRARHLVRTLLDQLAIAGFQV